MISDSYHLKVYIGKLKIAQIFKIKSNIYPVPDLNVPFFGVHLHLAQKKNQS